MGVKEECLELLKSLSQLGLTRTMIEKELGYGENAIDQALARGGNPKMKAALALLLRYAMLKQSSASQVDYEKFSNGMEALYGALSQIIHSVEPSSGDAQKIAPRLNRVRDVSRFEESARDKSKVQNQPAEQDKLHVKDKKSKDSASG